jgi:hypothetical protein
MAILQAHNIAIVERSLLKTLKLAKTKGPSSVG